MGVEPPTPAILPPPGPPGHPTRKGEGKVPRDRHRAERLGRRAETAACWFLRLKGFRILARRAKTPVGEIDIVARRGGLVAFVEVKARADLDQAAESLLPRQKQRLVRAAEWWLARREHLVHHTIRFDVILVAGSLPRRHFAGAFDASR